MYGSCLMYHRYHIQGGPSEVTLETPSSAHLRLTPKSTAQLSKVYCLYHT